MESPSRTGAGATRASTSLMLTSVRARTSLRCIEEEDPDYTLRFEPQMLEMLVFACGELPVTHEAIMEAIVDASEACYRFETIEYASELIEDARQTMGEPRRRSTYSSTRSVWRACASRRACGRRMSYVVLVLRSGCPWTGQAADVLVARLLDAEPRGRRGGTPAPRDQGEPARSL